MIPISSLFKDIYIDRFGDPNNPNPVDVPSEEAEPRHARRNWLVRLFARRRRRRDAWSFTLPPRQR